MGICPNRPLGPGFKATRDATREAKREATRENSR